MCDCDHSNSQRPGIFLRSGYMASEYGWEVDGLYEQTNSAETVLCVLLDSGAHRQFSRVRITLCCQNTIAENSREAWQIKPKLSSPSIVNCVSSHSSEPNPSSLPTYHAVFEIHQHTVTHQRSDSTPGRPSYFVPPPSVNLVLRDRECEESQAAPFHAVFDFDHPLTEDTRSVSVSFTSSQALTTSIFRDVFRPPMTLSPAMIGRVVRVMPGAPIHDRRTVSLPKDILRSIFECFLYPEYRGWRRDIVSSALVCRKWTCALDLLLFDFLSWNQRKSRPELFSFANALALRPDLAHPVKYLSTDHFTANMKKGFDLAGTLWPLVSGIQTSHEMLWQVTESHLSHYRSAFLSIFRAAKNVRMLSLSPVLSTTDLLDALSGLTNLEVLHAGHKVSTDQILNCVSACPSLKRLLIANGSRSFDCLGSVPHSPPRCALTEIMISACHISDAQLRYLTSSSTQSSPTLERLALVGVTGPSHKTLRSILQTVSRSLVVLQIWETMLQVEEGEQDFEADEFIPEEFGSREHALDSVIVHLERLQTLKITPNVATALVLERRARAFESSIGDASHTLPVIDLTLVHVDSLLFKGSSLVEVAERAWPGWAITSTKVPRGRGPTAFIDPVEFFEPRART